MIDGMMNNAPSTDELEARAKKPGNDFLFGCGRGQGEAKSQADPKDDAETKKPSIRAQLAAKEEQKRSPGRGKNQRNGGMRNVFHREEEETRSVCTTTPTAAGRRQISAALPTWTEMAALACQTADKLDAMSDADLRRSGSTTDEQ